MCAAAFGLRHEVAAVRADVDIAVQVRPEEPRAMILEPRHSLRRRMPVRIAPAGADDCNAWIERVDEGVGRCRSAAVMGDLEDVDAPGDARGDALGEQLRINFLLDVAGEQHPAVTEVQLEHDGDVVDRRSAVGRVERDCAALRPIDVELDAIEPQLVAGGNDSAGAAQLGHLAPVRGIAGAWTDHAGFDNVTYSVAVEQ